MVWYVVRNVARREVGGVREREQRGSRQLRVECLGPETRRHVHVHVHLDPTANFYQGLHRGKSFPMEAQGLKLGP